MQQIKDSIDDMKFVSYTQKEARDEKASWWEWLNYTWAHDLLYRAQKGEKINLKDLGGINEKNSLKTR